MKIPISNFYCLHRAESNVLSKVSPFILISVFFLKKILFIFFKKWTFQACVKPSRYFPAHGAVTPKKPTRLKPFTHALEQTRFAVSLWRTHNCALRPSRSSRCSLASARPGEQRATRMSRPIKQINK